MPDQPLTPDLVWLGFNVLYAVGGFLGGIVSLSFGKDLSVIGGVIAVISSVASSAGLTPLVVVLTNSYLLDEAMPLEARFTVAFLVGLTAMNIIPGILKLSEVFKRHPMLIFKKGRKEEDE